jgi:hypothetical protein
MKINEVIVEGGVLSGLAKGVGGLAKAAVSGVATGIAGAVAPDTMSKLKQRSSKFRPTVDNSGMDAMDHAKEIYVDWKGTYADDGNPVPTDPTEFLDSLNKFLGISDRTPIAFTMANPPAPFKQGKPIDVHGNYQVQRSLKSLKPADVQKYIASTILYANQQVSMAKTRSRAYHPTSEPAPMTAKMTQSVARVRPTRQGTGPLTPQEQTRAQQIAQQIAQQSQASRQRELQAQQPPPQQPSQPQVIAKPQSARLAKKKSRRGR